VGTSLHLLRIAGQVEESGARLAAWELLLLLLGTTDELGLLTGEQAGTQAATEGMYHTVQHP
jgi:hypothetical protein